jgi:hypothetical protein
MEVEIFRLAAQVLGTQRNAAATSDGTGYVVQTDAGPQACGVRKFGLACKSFGMSTEWCAPHGSEARSFLLIGDLCDAPFG